MNGDYEHLGGCLCGAVRYRAMGHPVATNYCHCRMCQRNAGAPVVAWATWPLSAFTVLDGQPAVYRSSERAQRSFCSRCGTPLTWQRVAAETSTIDIATATLDDPSVAPPTVHIWTESRIPWFDTRDELPRRDGG